MDDGSHDDDADSVRDALSQYIRGDHIHGGVRDHSVHDVHGHGGHSDVVHGVRDVGDGIWYCVHVRNGGGHGGDRGERDGHHDDVRDVLPKRQRLHLRIEILSTEVTCQLEDDNLAVLEVDKMCVFLTHPQKGMSVMNLSTAVKVKLVTETEIWEEVLFYMGTTFKEKERKMDLYCLLVVSFSVDSRLCLSLCDGFVCRLLFTLPFTIVVYSPFQSKWTFIYFLLFRVSPIPKLKEETSKNERTETDSW